MFIFIMGEKEKKKKEIIKYIKLLKTTKYLKS